MVFSFVILSWFWLFLLPPASVSSWVGTWERRKKVKRESYFSRVHVICRFLLVSLICVVGLQVLGPL